MKKNKRYLKSPQPLTQALATLRNHIENTFVHLPLMDPQLTEPEIDTCNTVAQDVLAGIVGKYGSRQTYAICAVMHRACVEKAIEGIEKAIKESYAKVSNH